MKKSNLQPYFIYGKHASIAALANKNRIIHRIITTEKNLNLIPKTHKDKVEILTPQDISKIIQQDSTHQGIAVKVSPIASSSLEDIAFPENATLAILDQVTDPHNLGAILRNALAFGISGIIIPVDNATTENGVVAKASSGALEIVPLFRVINIAATIEYLKKQQFWIVGLDGEASDILSPKHLSGKACIVLGAEGSGLRRLTRAHCDFLTKIDIKSEMESLNVSAASAVAFYISSLS